MKMEGLKRLKCILGKEIEQFSQNCCCCLGRWQIIAKDPNNEQDTIRWLKVKPREGEAVTLTLGINPKDTWAGQGIFNFISECGDESGAKRTQGEKVMEHDLEG